MMDISRIMAYVLAHLLLPFMISFVLCSVTAYAGFRLGRYERKQDQYRIDKYIKELEIEVKGSKNER